MNHEYAAKSLIQMTGSTWRRVDGYKAGAKMKVIQIYLGKRYVSGNYKWLICATWQEAYEKLAERMRVIG